MTNKSNDNDEDFEYYISLPSSQPSLHDSDKSNAPNYADEVYVPAIKRRRRFTIDETKVLEKEYEINPSPNQQRIQEIANSISTPRKIVTTWFQNRRAKNKRKEKLAREGNQAGEEDFEYEEMNTIVNTNLYNEMHQCYHAFSCIIDPTFDTCNLLLGRHQIDQLILANPEFNFPSFINEYDYTYDNTPQNYTHRNYLVQQFNEENLIHNAFTRSLPESSISNYFLNNTTEGYSLNHFVSPVFTDSNNNLCVNPTDVYLNYSQVSDTDK